MQVFAVVGESLQQVGGSCPEGWVEMSEQRPAPHYVVGAGDDGVAVWVEPPPIYCKFYGNEKLDLFTPTEQLSVVEATYSVPMVKLVYDRLLGAAYLTYEDAETEQGLQLLVDKGLLTDARKAEIVASMTVQEI